MVNELERLISEMKALGTLKSRRLEDVLREVPRENFLPKKLGELAYRDIPLSIGHEQTISQPSTVAIMTEALDVRPGQKILEIGSGSGWQAAILAKLAGPEGFVWSVERLKPLAEFAGQNLKNAGIGNAKVIYGDGSLGLPEHAPYDRIIATCACPELPEPWARQLKVGGRIVAPIGDLYLQVAQIITKVREGCLERKNIGNFMFVPLRGRYGFR